MSETFVLIHGTWHGGWAWQEVIRHLEAQGHRAYAPTLIGHSPADERVGITHRDCVNSVVSYIRQRDLHDVILVGHSFGGTVISKAVEELSGRIKRLIFVNAFVLEDGQSLSDNLPRFLIELLAPLADNTIMIPWEAWRDYFIQDAPPEVARVRWEQLAPSPYQPGVEKLDLKVFYSLTLPKSYISSRQDISLPPGSFHPQMSRRLGTFKLVEMDGSHEVMFTRPAELAEKLLEASL